MPNYIVLRGISTLVRLVVASTEGLVSQALHSRRREYAKHIRGQRGRWDSPLLFGIVVENVVKEPDVTLILEYIQTVDNANYFKTMSLHQQARETHNTIQLLRSLYQENQRRAEN